MTNACANSETRVESASLADTETRNERLLFWSIPPANLVFLPLPLMLTVTLYACVNEMELLVTPGEKVDQGTWMETGFCSVHAVLSSGFIYYFFSLLSLARIAYFILIPECVRRSSAAACHDERQKKDARCV